MQANKQHKCSWSIKAAKRFINKWNVQKELVHRFVGIIVKFIIITRIMSKELNKVANLMITLTAIGAIAVVLLILSVIIFAIYFLIITF